MLGTFYVTTINLDANESAEADGSNIYQISNTPAEPIVSIDKLSIDKIKYLDDNIIMLQIYSFDHLNTERSNTFKSNILQCKSRELISCFYIYDNYTD